MSGYALGVDLGTTHMAAAGYQDGRAVVVPLGQNNFAAPSAVYVNPEGKVAIGPQAMARGREDPTGLVLNAKRLLGSNNPKIIRGRPYQPEALMGVMLRWVLSHVEKATGARPDHVTLTHPANWLDHRLGRLKEVAAAVGRESVGLQPEPDAAAVYHAAVRSIPTGAILGVYDLGGGTFDATIIRKTAVGLELIGEPAGVDNLGGIDFDAALRNHVLAQVSRLADQLDETDPSTLRALRKLDDRIIEAKIALSKATTTDVLVEFPGSVTEVRVTREEFHELIRPDIELTIDELERAVSQASLAADDLHAVLLVGGSSRIPLVSELLGARIGCEVRTDEHPKLAVSLGAAITAGAVALAGVAPGPAAAATAAPPAEPEALRPPPPTPQPERPPPPAPPQAPAPRPSPAKPAPAAPEQAVSRKSSLLGAHGTLHISGSGPSAVEVSVDLEERNLAGKTDDTAGTFGGVPLAPVVDPFPRDLWLNEHAGDSGDDPPPSTDVIVTPGSGPSADDKKLVIALTTLVVAVIIIVVILALAT